VPSTAVNDVSGTVVPWKSTVPQKKIHIVSHAMVGKKTVLHCHHLKKHQKSVNVIVIGVPCAASVAHPDFKVVTLTHSHVATDEQQSHKKKQQSHLDCENKRPKTVMKSKQQ